MQELSQSRTVNLLSWLHLTHKIYVIKTWIYNSTLLLKYYHYLDDAYPLLTDKVRTSLLVLINLKISITDGDMIKTPYFLISVNNPAFNVSSPPFNANIFHKYFSLKYDTFSLQVYFNKTKYNSVIFLMKIIGIMCPLWLIYTVLNSFIESFMCTEDLITCFKHWRYLRKYTH